MAEYRIVAAKPKNASNHVNSRFKLYEWDKKGEGWSLVGWVSIDKVSELLQGGHDVKTAKLVDRELFDGAAVELELRIAKNNTDFKISDMPDT